MVAFATHGLLAAQTEQFGGPPEPALVLTPVVGQDPFLATSEIARLNLDADWVILSACNTAAPEGRTGAEGFSGLTKAFFDAGGRTLLVSHWYVSEWTTTRLLGDLLRQLSEDPQLGRAAALARAARQVRDGGLALHAHPAFWGAFVVGEGRRA